MKPSTKDTTLMTDEELAEEQAKLEKEIAKMKSSPVMEHPEQFKEIYKEWKKKGKIGFRERVLHFMIMTLKTVLCIQFANFRDKFHQAMIDGGESGSCVDKIVFEAERTMASDMGRGDFQVWHQRVMQRHPSMPRIRFG